MSTRQEKGLDSPQQPQKNSFVLKKHRNIALETVARLS